MNDNRKMPTLNYAVVMDDYFVLGETVEYAIDELVFK